MVRRPDRYAGSPVLAGHQYPLRHAAGLCGSILYFVSYTRLVSIAWSNVRPLSSAAASVNIMKGAPAPLPGAFASPATSGSIRSGPTERDTGSSGLFEAGGGERRKLRFTAI